MCVSVIDKDAITDDSTNQPIDMDDSTKRPTDEDDLTNEDTASSQCDQKCYRVFVEVDFIKTVRKLYPYN